MSLIQTKFYNIYFNSRWEPFNAILKSKENESSDVFVLVDTHTEKYCLPILLQESILSTTAYKLIEIPAGESFKTLDTCRQVWSFLTDNQADRESLLINLGGGVLCDIGAFCAATFKRGISYVNIPTTLLAMTDASVGAKAAVNFGGFKNLIGYFYAPKAVFVYEKFLKTVADSEMKSGYAEMIKHALIGGEDSWKKFCEHGFEKLDKCIFDSINIKNEVVAADPFEKNERKKLNLGHSIGHAIEMLSTGSVKNTLKHGHAVAIGMLCMLHISQKFKGLTVAYLKEISKYIINHYDYYPIDRSLYASVFEHVKQDKKNQGNRVLMVLMEKPGEIFVDCEVTAENIFEALDFYNSIYKES